jgi:glycosyltransferase involved in cell wall biosynthesis
MSKTVAGQAGIHSLVAEKVSGNRLIPVERKAFPFINCVLPAYNEEESLGALIPLLCAQLMELSPYYEIIVVDDGSGDNTAQVAVNLSAQYPVRLVQLARNFGKESALTAGIDHANGDLIILMDADFQHPIEVLPRFFRRWRQGFDMVYGIRADRDQEYAWKRRCSQWFYAFLTRSASSVTIEPDAGDFRLLDRRVIDALRDLPERNRFMKGLYAWVGFKTIGITYQVENRRSGQSGFNFRRLMELAITGVTSFTSLPLRFCSGFGALVSLISILYGFYIALKTVVFGIDLPGWATLVVAISFLSGAQLLSIGILGEYIARVFMEVKQRPTYVVGRCHDYSVSESKDHEEWRANCCVSE